MYHVQRRNNLMRKITIVKILMIMIMIKINRILLLDVKIHLKK